MAQAKRMPLNLGLSKLNQIHPTPLIEVVTDLEQAFEEIRQAEIFSLDLETTGLGWWKPGGRATHGAICLGAKTLVFLDTNFDFFRGLRGLLSDPALTLIGHNIKFDLHWFEPKLKIDELNCKIIDTNVGLFLLDENKQNGLKPAIKRIFKHELRSYKDVVGTISEEVPDSRTKKGTRKKRRKGTILEANQEEVIKYVAEDSYWTYRLWFNHVLLNLKANRELFNNFTSIQMPLLKVLFFMEERGVEVDIESALSLKQQYEVRLKQIDESIHRSLPELNPASPKQLDEFLYNKLQYSRPPFKNKRKDEEGNKIESKYDTSELALLWLAKEQDSEIAKLLLERRKYSKLVSTYLKPIIEAVNGRLHTNFNQTVARTGRLSSSGSINLQNIPRDKEIRNLFKAREGFKLLSMDLSQAELRLLAHYSQDEELIKAFKEGRDLHWDTAEATGLSELLSYEDARFAGKTANFSMAYGVWADTFRYTLYKETEGRINLTKEEAKEGLNKLSNERFTGISKWKRNIIQSAKMERQPWVTIDNRKRRLAGIKASNWQARSYAERQGINAIIQGSVGDIINRIMAQFWYKTCLEYAVMQIHDELILEVPDWRLRDREKEEAVENLENKIQDYYHLTVPIKIDYKLSERWVK